MDYKNLAPDKKQKRSWLYHPTRIPIIVYEEQVEEFKKEGWCDSPADFAKPEQFGVDPKDEARLQDVEEKLDGIAENLNGQLNFEAMNKKELIKYGVEHQNVDLKAIKFTNVQRRKILKGLAAGKTHEEMGVKPIESDEIEVIEEDETFGK